MGYIWQILQYPLMGSVVLLGLYYLIKNVEEITINTLLDIIFLFVTVVYGGNKLHQSVEWLCENMQLR